MQLGAGLVRPLHSSNTLAQTASWPKGQALGAISIIPSLAFFAVQGQKSSTFVPTQLSPHSDLKSTWQGLYRVVAGSYDSLVGPSLHRRGLRPVNFHFNLTFLSPVSTNL